MSIKYEILVNNKTITYDEQRNGNNEGLYFGY